jgi:hypothetical protein
MPIINRIADFHDETTQWRHRIHAYPETAFEERKTAQLVSELLESFWISADCGTPEPASSERSRDRYRVVAPLRCAPTSTHCM